MGLSLLHRVLSAQPGARRPACRGRRARAWLMDVTLTNVGAQRGLVLTTVPRGGGPKGGRKDFKQCMATRLAGARGRG